MPAGTITLTNNSTAVTGSGTAFPTELKANDFLVAVVGGTTYTLGVKSVESATALTLATPYGGPTTGALAWTPIPNGTLVGITAQIAADTARAIRGLNYDKQNWQQVYSSSGNITVTLPDGSTWTGPSWKYLSDNMATKVSGAVPLTQGGLGATDAAGGRNTLQLGNSATRNVGEGANTVLGMDSYGVGSLNLRVIGDIWDKSQGTRFCNVSPSTSGGPGGYASGIRLSDRNIGSGSSAAGQQSFAALLLGGKVMQFMGMADGVSTGWLTVYHTGNTTRASDGTLKGASPVVKLFSDGQFENNDESEGCTVTRTGVGTYRIDGCIGLNADAAWGGIDGGFDIPTDRNKQPLIWLDYEVNGDGSVLVKTYHRTYPNVPEFAQNKVGHKNDDGSFTETVVNGDLIDIPADQFVSVRVEMPQGSIFNQKQAAAQKAMEEAERAAAEQADSNPENLHNA